MAGLRPAAVGRGAEKRRVRRSSPAWRQSWQDCEPGSGNSGCGCVSAWLATGSRPLTRKPDWPAKPATLIARGIASRIRGRLWPRNDRQSARHGPISSDPPRVRAHLPLQASLHQEIANRITDRQWADRDSHLEEPGAQPGGTTLYRLRTRGGKAAGEEVMSCRAQYTVMSLLHTQPNRHACTIMSAQRGEII
jgi:hypothetical protein